MSEHIKETLNFVKDQGRTQRGGGVGETPLEHDILQELYDLRKGD